MAILLNIQVLCKKDGISITNLEEKLDFGRGTIYKWDKNSPSVDRLQKVAEYFNVTVDYLLDDSEDKTELNIPNELKGVKVAFHRGEFEDLTQDEVDALAVIARTLKAQRKGTKDNDKT